MGDQHFVARIPIEPVREEFIPSVVLWVKKTSSERALTNAARLSRLHRPCRTGTGRTGGARFPRHNGRGLAHPIRGRAGRPVIEERDSIVQREKGMDLLPVRARFGCLGIHTPMCSRHRPRLADSGLLTELAPESYLPAPVPRVNSATAQVVRCTTSSRLHGGEGRRCTCLREPWPG